MHGPCVRRVGRPKEPVTVDIEVLHQLTELLRPVAHPRVGIQACGLGCLDILVGIFVGAGLQAQSDAGVRLKKTKLNERKLDFPEKTDTNRHWRGWNLAHP